MSTIIVPPYSIIKCHYICQTISQFASPITPVDPTVQP